MSTPWPTPYDQVRSERIRRGGFGCARCPAFTLIELLVVIGIIALLVGILLPALASARSSAKVAVCASNQRQISMQWEMFLMDHNEAYPVMPQGYNLQWKYGGNPDWWVPDPPDRALTPYTSDPEMFRCPAERPIRKLAGGYVTQGSTSGRVYTTYEFFGNCYMGNLVILQQAVHDDDKYWEGIHLSDIQVSTSKLILAGDPQWYYATNDPRYEADFHDRQNKINLTFVDGHVSFIHVEEDQTNFDEITWIYFKQIPTKWTLEGGAMKDYFSEEEEAAN